MTKAELIAAMKDFPDDTKIRFSDKYETWTDAYIRTREIDRDTNKELIDVILRP